MKLIAAVDQNWAIGNRDDLLVHIPEDQKNFRRITTGNVVVLGRKTLSGFPGGRPLKDRLNVILTKNPDFEAGDAVIVRSQEELFEQLKKYPSNEVYVIGGGTLYKMLEPYCDEAIITKIDYSYQADTYFPNLDEKENWELVEEGEEQTYFDLIYHFDTYRNKTPKEI
ncbi:MAG: dihydrofolate reductase [Lachnospiraceae bacterium]|nr:dihydrofolate reductase [Lachnospiraceae bacterium]